MTRMQKENMEKTKKTVVRLASSLISLIAVLSGVMVGCMHTSLPDHHQS